VECGNVGNEISTVIGAVQKAGGVIASIHSQGTNLEAIYLKLTGKELRD
jgi:hypothetical protein